MSIELDQSVGKNTIRVPLEEDGCGRCLVVFGEGKIGDLAVWLPFLNLDEFQDEFDSNRMISGLYGPILELYEDGSVRKFENRGMLIGSWIEEEK